MAYTRHWLCASVTLFNTYFLLSISNFTIFLFYFLLQPTKKINAIFIVLVVRCPLFHRSCLLFSSLFDSFRWCLAGFTSFFFHLRQRRQLTDALYSIRLILVNSLTFLMKCVRDYYIIVNCRFDFVSNVIRLRPPKSKHQWMNETERDCFRQRCRNLSQSKSFVCTNQISRCEIFTCYFVS